MTDSTQRKEALFLGDLRKTYHAGTVDVPVLKGVNFEVYRGEFIGIMGSSGSGKSTLLNILGLLDKPTSGVYRLDGQAVETLSDRELTTIRNIKIGFVFQAFNLFPHLTVQENIEVPMMYAGVDIQTRHKVSKTGNEIMALFHELHRAGTTIVMVTHNPQYEPEYDRVIYLRNGRKWRVVDNVNHKTEEFET